MEGSVCTGCPEILLGGCGGRGEGRGVALSEGYSFLFFLHLIHLGPKPSTSFLLLPTRLAASAPPPAPRETGEFSKPGGGATVFFSMALFGAISLLSRLCVPEEPCSPLGLVPPPQRASSMPLPLGAEAAHPFCAGRRPERAVEEPEEPGCLVLGRKAGRQAPAGPGSSPDQQPKPPDPIHRPALGSIPSLAAVERW